MPDWVWVVVAYAVLVGLALLMIRLEPPARRRK